MVVLQDERATHTWHPNSSGLLEAEGGATEVPLLPYTHACR